MMLQVRFAEVNRRALTELGAQSSSSTARTIPVASTTQQFAAPTHRRSNKQAPARTFSDFLNIFFFNRQEGSAPSSRRSQSKGFFQSLAEPNLIAYNSQEASFLAGGEIPGAGRSGRREQRRHRHVQGVRHPADVHADDCRRCRSG